MGWTAEELEESDIEPRKGKELSLHIVQAVSGFHQTSSEYSDKSVKLAITSI
jgi:hypothetical protein